MAFPFKEQLKTISAIEKGFVTTRAIYERDPDYKMISILAINQRLLRLWRVGYVTKKGPRNGPYIYSLTRKGKALYVRARAI